MTTRRIPAVAPLLSFPKEICCCFRSASQPAQPPTSLFQLRILLRKAEPQQALPLRRAHAERTPIPPPKQPLSEPADRATSPPPSRPSTHESRPECNKPPAAHAGSARPRAGHPPASRACAGGPSPAPHKTPAAAAPPHLPRRAAAEQARRCTSCRGSSRSKESSAHPRPGTRPASRSPKTSSRSPRSALSVPASPGSTPGLGAAHRRTQSARRSRRSR